ncbi:MAG: GspMb/PilO family protein [Acidobacteriota bacterium]|nr:GspMb/PilO family protein [Acidobacteriota bacterium]
MKALFTVGSEVPFARVVSDHRRVLVPLGAVLIINLVVLVAVVLPLRRSVQSADIRSRAAAVALRDAILDLNSAEATREGQGQARKDLERFYKDVLPAGVSAARRLTNLKLGQMVRQHDVNFQRSASSPETNRDSELERLKISYTLSGDWEDIRMLIHDIETGPDFVVIDNVVLQEGSEASAPLSLSLDLSTYYRVGPHAP